MSAPPRPPGDIWKEPHIVVLASAGTGKTFRLTNRFIALVNEGADPVSILAATFTRKAAGEILERILTRLADGASGSGKELALLKEHVDPRINEARCAELLGLVCASLHRLSVLTIDALLARIVAAYAPEAGIGPEWRIVDDAEDELLRSRAVVDVLAEDDRAQMFAFLHMLHAGGFGRKVHEAVLGAMQSVYSAYRRTLPFPGVWDVIGPEGPVDRAARDRALSTLAAAPRHFALTQGRKPDKRWTISHDKLLEALGQERWEAALRGGLGEKIAAGEGTFCSLPISPGVIEAYAPTIRIARAVMLQKLKDRNAATVALAARFDTAYSAAKRSANAFRFDDLAPLVIEGLGPDGGGGAAGLDHLYFRLDARFRHVLLDEFQDTSLAQFRVLEPMVGEILAGEGAGDDRGPARSVFCVGDAKQSLYSWREAEPALLPSLSERWPQLSTRMLQESHRSSPAILGAVNAVFAGIGSNAALAAGADGAARSWGGQFAEHTASDPDAPGLVRLVVAPDAGPGASTRERERAAIRTAAERVREIAAAAPHATIGVLLRTNRNIPHLIYELAEREPRIHASQEGGSPLMDSPPVAAAVSLMHLADHPGDSAARFHVATSPLGGAVGLTDPDDARAADRAASELRRELLETGYAATLSRLLTACAGSMEARGFRRFRRLIEFAQGFDEGAGGAALRPSEFCRRALAGTVEDPAGANVRVMSIHKSKGLEFDAVILPDLDRRWQIRPGEVLLDRPEPLGAIRAATVYPNKELRAADPRLAAMHAQQLQREAGEELSCLYVGMTRARRYLEMIVLPGKAESGGGAAYPLAAAGVLHAALAPGRALDPGVELWSTARGACRDDRSPTAWAGPEPSRGAPAQAEELPFDVPKPAGRSLARARARTPSSLEGAGVIRIADLLRLDDSPALSRGTLFHEWFRLVGWLDEGAPADAELLAIASDVGIAEADARSQLAAFRAALAHPAIRPALGRARYAPRPGGVLAVRREWSFAVIDTDESGRPAILRGQFDRVVIARDRAAGRALWADIIDFKTDRIGRADAALIAERTDHYRPQLLAYRRAAARMLGLDESRVTASLLFLEPGKLAEVVQG